MPEDDPPDDRVASIGEPLFAASAVKLIGRRFTGLALTDNLGLRAATGNPLAALLGRLKAEGGPNPFMLARIYGYVFMGAYHDMPDLPVMLVFGPALPVSIEIAEAIGFSLGVRGAADDVSIWEMDSLDAALRIDISIGWLSELLVLGAGAPPPEPPAPPERASGGAGFNIFTKRQDDSFGNSIFSRRRPGQSGDNIFVRRRPKQ